MRNLISRLRATTVYTRASFLWSWWGVIEDQVGRITLVSVVAGLAITFGQYLWGRFISEWPSHVLYITTAVTLASAIVIVLVALVYSRLSAVLAAATPVPAGRVRRAPIELVEDEITWVEGGHTGWFGTRPRPECTEQRHFELMARHPADRYSTVQQERITSIRHGDSDRPYWVPYCPEGKHDVRVPGGLHFYQAEELAQARIEGRAKAASQ